MNKFYKKLSKSLDCSGDLFSLSKITAKNPYIPLLSKSLIFKQKLVFTKLF